MSSRTAGKGSEIAVAMIGLVGMIATGVLTNIDKIFHTTVQAQYTGYHPTGDFDTELRYFLEVSGAHKMVDSMQQQVLQSAKADLLSKYPGQADSIDRTFDALAKEPVRFEDVFQALLPVYRNHYTVSQIQELNKFYSTDVMRSMVKEAPLVMQDAAPIMVKLMNDYIARTANISMQ